MTYYTSMQPQYWLRTFKNQIVTIYSYFLPSLSSQKNVCLLKHMLLILVDNILLPIEYICAVLTTASKMALKRRFWVKQCYRNATIIATYGRSVKSVTISLNVSGNAIGVFHPKSVGASRYTPERMSYFGLSNKICYKSITINKLNLSFQNHFTYILISYTV